MIECGHAEATPGAWLANLLPGGVWGYVNCASVTAVGAQQRGGARTWSRRRSGLSRPAGAGVRGTYLYYNPPNPLSSVFWPRVGYAPLWTLWEVRPAAGLR